MANYVETFVSKLDWAMPFQRTGPFPIERTQMFDSYDDAVKYAKGDLGDPDKRELCGTSYIGQIITVYENSVVTVYKIEEDRSLSEVGTATNGDDKSIVLSDGLLSLYGFSTAQEGQQCRVKNIGSSEEPKLVLEWYTPDTSIVDGLRDKVQELEENVNTINGNSETPGSIDYKIAENNKNYYDKTAIDGKLTGALHYKGTYETFAALQAAVADSSLTPAVGDVYNITNAGGTDSNGTKIKAGDNVICASYDAGSGSPTATWDVSSGTVDLSNYYSKSEIDNALNKKVDAVEGSRLMTNNEGNKLAELVKVEESETNGNIKLDGSETTVYTLPTATSNVLGGVKGSAEKDKVNVESDGTMSITTVSGSKVDGAVPEATKTTAALTIGSKTFDGSTPQTVTADDIPLPDNIITKDDIATTATVGVVKGSADQDNVTVNGDGTMTVNNISGSKVKGAVAEATKTTAALTIGSKTFDGSTPKTVTAEDLGALTDADMGDYVKFENLASNVKTGVVKSTTDTTDKIKVEADGTMSVYKVSGSKVEGTVAKATDSDKLGNVAATDILVDSEGLTAKVKSATAADKLATAHNIVLTGDATGSASFDGTNDASIAVTLPDIATGGTYTKVTINNKGQVTKGESLTASDIPSLTMNKITNAGALATKNQVAEIDLDTALSQKINTLNDNSHTHANKTVLDRITSEKVTKWDQTAVTIENKADKANTLAGYGITDAYTKEEVNGMVGGAFHYKNTYDTFAALTSAISDGTITSVLVGDVYNIRTAGGTDSEGVQIKAGDNIVAKSVSGNSPDFVIEWDVLSGTVDLSNYYNKSDIDGKLLLKADQSKVTEISGKVDVLETTVSDPETGLVKKVADNTAAIGTNTSDIANLKTAVGNSDSEGLRKKVADNTAAITTLNGEKGTPGSVKQIVAASVSELNTAISQITEESTGTIDTRIAAHNTAADAHQNLFNVKQNKIIHKEVTIATTAFTVNDGDNGPMYKGTVTVEGLGASKNYVAQVSPKIESCKVVQAAQFYPVTEMNNNALTVYCVNIPTQDIILNCTFTEIQ